jgi:hypothetical protein
MCLALRLNPQDKTEAATLLLIRLSALSGLLGVVPVALLGEDLICTCSSELCYSIGFVCKLNQASIYVVIAAVLTLLLKFSLLLAKLKGAMAKQSLLENWRVQQLVWAVPLLLAMVSFGVEEHGNEKFHLARAGARCQFRYRAMLDEVFLLHLPISLCVVLLAYFIGANLMICLSAILVQNKERTVGNVLSVLKKRPEMQRMMIVSFLSCVLIVLWLSQATASWLVFENYFKVVEEWMRCVRYDFARHAAVGAPWNEGVLVLAASGDGRICPAVPAGTALFESNVLKSMFEVLMPILVASTFSWRLLQDVIRWRRVGRFKTTAAVIPLPFDSQAYDRKETVVNSVRADMHNATCNRTARDLGLEAPIVKPALDGQQEQRAEPAADVQQEQRAESAADVQQEQRAEPSPKVQKMPSQSHCGGCQKKFELGEGKAECLSCAGFAFCLPCHQKHVETGIPAHTPTGKVCRRIFFVNVGASASAYEKPEALRAAEELRGAETLKEAKKLKPMGKTRKIAPQFLREGGKMLSVRHGSILCETQRITSTKQNES